jgi:hypothetical protein
MRDTQPTVVRLESGSWHMLGKGEHKSTTLQRAAEQPLAAAQLTQTVSRLSCQILPLDNL